MRAVCTTRSYFLRLITSPFSLVAVAMLAGPVRAGDAVATQPVPAISGAIAPNPLLAIDQNRTTVVDRVADQWGDALASSGAGLSREQLQALLGSLRSDQLLAASLAGSLEGLRNVIANALTANAPVAQGLIQTKALGDAAADLVYTPVTPCREVDTRNAGGPLGSFSSRDFKVWVSAGGFTAQGGSATNCNIPVNPAAVMVNIAAVSPAGAGNFSAYPTGTPTLTSVLNYQSGQIALSNGAIVPVCQPGCANQLTIATNGAGADVVIDIVGYFQPPSGASGSLSTSAVKFADGTIQTTAALAPPPCFDHDNRYKDCGDGTVMDKQTGLMWEKKLASSDPGCTSETQATRDVHCVQNHYTWSGTAPFTEPIGTLYSDFLERLNDLKAPNDGTATPCFAGHCDWRIPTIGELRSIILAPYPACPSSPCIDSTFGPTQEAFYWSSSPLASFPQYAWSVFFVDGFVSNNEDYANYARAVRGGR